MAEYLIQDTTLDAIADAINAKTGGSSAMTPAQMVTAIGTISGGGAVITKKTYTQTEDWLNDSDSYQKFITTYIQNNSTAISLVVINNTSTDNLSGQAAVYDNVLTLTIVCRRKNGIGSAAGNTFKIGAGSTITIYEIQRSAFQ